METKSFWKSKTVWLNILAVIVEILVFTETSPVVPKDWLPVIALIHGVANIVLRFISNQPLGWKSGPSDSK